MKVFIAALLCVLVSALAYADRDSSPTGAKAVASANGSHFLLVIPATPQMQSWLWTVYEVAPNGTFKEKWSSDGIWGREMFLSDDGNTVVWVESWPSGSATEGAVVIATYRDGRLMRAYRATDLVDDATNIPHSASVVSDKFVA